MIIKPAKFSAGFVTKTFFPYEWNHRIPGHINTGRCYDWAYLAYCLWDNVTLWSHPSHAWVKVGKKHYDSECVRGTFKADLLPLNDKYAKHNMSDAREHSASEFHDHWNVYGGGARFHWHTLRKQIEDMGLELVRK
jgi:hypothetical protein